MTKFLKYGWITLTYWFVNTFEECRLPGRQKYSLLTFLFLFKWMVVIADKYLGLLEASKLGQVGLFFSLLSVCSVCIKNGATELGQ